MLNKYNLTLNSGKGALIGTRMFLKNTGEPQISFLLFNPPPLETANLYPTFSKALFVSPFHLP